MRKHLLLLITALLLMASGVKAQSLTAIPNVIEHLDYIGSGPSVAHCYTLFVQNFEGEQVIVTAPEYFEISLNENDFDSLLMIQFEEDSTLVIQYVPIYVRLKAGLEEGAYEDSITNQCGTASVAVQVSGIVEVPKAPTVTTFEVTDIGINRAKGGGWVVDDGHSDVTGRGVCWRTSSTPTIGDDTIHCDSGTGVFFADMTGLLPETKYYVRAYAINGIGITYGDTVSFTTLEPVLYNVYVDCNTGGNVTVDKTTAHESDTVNITVDVDGYHKLDSLWIYKIDHPTQTVDTVNDSYTFLMPACNVMAKAKFVHKQATIDSIAQPNPICEGDTLELEMPDYEFANDATGVKWQLSNQEDFDGHVIVYEEGQSLDASFNGWWLRFMVSYPWGNSYSNSVQITVNDMDGFAIIGDTDFCTNQESEYLISGSGGENDLISWQVSDTSATVTMESDFIKVLWATAGQQRVSALVTDLQTGCSTQLEMNVTVVSYVDAAAIKAIVLKDDYDLVYPNPDNHDYKYQWYKGDTLIKGATKQYYFYEEGLDGKYKVYVSFNEDAEGNLICGAFSPEIVVTRAPAAASLSVYPNPANVGETIFVVKNDDGAALLTIYAIDGRMVHSQTIVGDRVSLGLVLPQGVYVARIAGNQESKTERIVIK